MSEAIPVYAAPDEGCRVCGGLHMYPLDEAVGSKRCIAYLRAEIGTLQGELLALRLALAAKPTPLITTYEQLAIATQIPIERLLALGAFAPEPQTQAEAAIADAAMWPELRVVAPGEV